jgi:glucose/arabinose dehydrogenase
MKKLFTILALVALAILLWFAFGNPQALLFTPTSQQEPAAISTQLMAEVVAKNLSVPWGVAFLPSGNLLISERAGTLAELTQAGERVAENNLPATTARGESGLLGVAVDPQFSDNGRIYLYQTVTTKDGAVENRVLRYQYKDGKLSREKVLVSGIRGASYHDGGRLLFSPAGNLLVTTGDGGEPSRAQDPTVLEGKVLRITTDGQPVVGNPFDNLVFTLGHRNPQGLAYDQAGNLWQSEHGRSGARSGLDEINLLMPGKNYGWPYLEGDEVTASQSYGDWLKITNEDVEGWISASLLSTSSERQESIQEESREQATSTE